MGLTACVDSPLTDSRVEAASPSRPMPRRSAFREAEGRAMTCKSAPPSSQHLPLYEYSRTGAWNADAPC